MSEAVIRLSPGIKLKFTFHEPQTEERKRLGHLIKEVNLAFFNQRKDGAEIP